MQQFLHDLGTYAFLRAAVAAGLLASVACGIVGTYVVVRRRSYIAGAIAHCVLGGMGAARYLQTVHGVEWLTPLLGAALAALLSALLIGLVTAFTQQREDTVLSLVWALGMAIGVSFIAATPGYNEDLMSYLFGNILMVARQDLWLMAGLNLAVVLLTVLFYNKFLVICFHEELARLRGLRVGIYNIVLLVLTALTVVLLVQVVGIVMVIALLTLPAATATHFASRLWQVMAVAVVVSSAVTIGGLALSYTPGWPAGATIIEAAAAVYLLTLLGHGGWRRLQQRRSIRAGAAAGESPG
jgi:zinc transport system permease protein